jgi:leukotriene-A4 hydrolase
LGQLYNLEKTRNCELLKVYLEIGIKAEWPAIIPKALEFVKANGRIKYLIPIYTSLFKWDTAAAQAIETFNKQRPLMHPISARLVANLMKDNLDSCEHCA